MIVKEVIRYDNAAVIEATFTTADGKLFCRAYGAEEMGELRSDLGADATQYEELIQQCIADYVPEPLPPIEQRRAAKWEQIKAERDRRKYLGVKVGEHWFHSDDPSRIQQLALVMMGASMPVGLQWKTLTLTLPPAFVEMAPALAQAIFQATALSDQEIFAAAEAHRIAMEASDNPEDYDFSGGWPATIYDAA